MSITEPFLRWAGGKNWFVNQYIDLTKNIDINHYHEPFLGGASIYFSIAHSSRSYLSDVTLFAKEYFLKQTFIVCYLLLLM